VLAVPCLVDRRERAVRVRMARAGAVTQLGHGVIDTRRPGVVTRPVFVGMTGCTVGLVRGLRVKHDLRIRCVTVGATQLQAVIARISARMHVQGRGPRSRGVTGVTLLRRHEMISALAGRTRSIVATAARRGDVAVVECSRDPRQDAVAVAAIGGGRDVAGRLAGCLHAIVAITARFGDT